MVFPVLLILHNSYPAELMYSKHWYLIVQMDVKGLRLMQYTINRAVAIYDVIDEDIVIIHLETGNYYNLSDSGALIWKKIAEKPSLLNKG